MNSSWKLRYGPALLVSLVILMAVTAGLVYLWADYGNKKDVVDYSIYTGVVYLQGEEYEEFKILLADRKDITIKQIDILSSENPLVNFRLTIKGNGTFPYGEREVLYKGRIHFAIVISFFAGIIGLALALWAGAEMYDYMRTRWE